jgi:peptide/nickel transport system permease protein
VLVAVMALAVLVGPLLTPYDGHAQEDPSSSKYKPPGTLMYAVELAEGDTWLTDRAVRTPEGLEIERRGETTTLPADRVTNLTDDGVSGRRFFPLGTDGFGRDLLTRILYGGRASLTVAVLAVAIALTLGILVGAVAGAGPRWLDTVLMRGVDALLAFPWLFLVLALTALFRPSTTLVTLVLGLTSWMSVSRLVRAEILPQKEREFVLAARGLGLHPARILFRHLIPNALNPVMVTAALSTGDVILAESALSFLGVGIQAPTPSWGNIVADGRVVLVTAWWVSLFPGIAIVVSVLAFNLLGDRLRDALDPRMRGRTAGLLGRMVGGPGAGTGSETDGSPRDAALASPSGDDD